MDMLQRTDDSGLQSVSNSVFPISDSGDEPARIRRLFDRQLEWQVRPTQSLHQPAFNVPEPELRRDHQTDPYHLATCLCIAAHVHKNIVTFCNRWGGPRAVQLKYEVPECEERGMT